MNTEGPRAIQAPFKGRYREEPEAALITLKAEGRLGEGVTCKGQTGKALVEAGPHPANGETKLVCLFKWALAFKRDVQVVWYHRPKIVRPETEVGRLRTLLDQKSRPQFVGDPLRGFTQNDQAR
jgi:hypothetical protein